MDRPFLDSIARRLRVTRSRRQVLTTATRGAVGGLGAALVARGLDAPVLDGGFSPVARAQAGECPATPCPAVANPAIRRDVSTLSAGQLASLRRGVAAMKQRAPSDPTSWIFQANMHAVPILTPEPLWCQHQSWFFLPWHRMYLYWFERILRQASGDPSLTLPYWNYSDNPAQRALPQAFGDQFDAAGNPNPLYEPRRAPGINDGSVGLSAQTVDYLVAFNQTNFMSDVTPPLPSFGGPKILTPMNQGVTFGSLELTPHGGVHVNVGGLSGIYFQTFSTEGVVEYHCGLHPAETGRIEISAAAPVPPNGVAIVAIDNSGAPSVFAPQVQQVPPGVPVAWVNVGFELPHAVTANDGSFDSGLLEPPGIMRFPELAARDPIFWLHHANIDRLWERWLALQGGRANPTDDCVWMNQVFPFYREDGSSVSMTARDVLDTVNCLGYRYDDPLTIFTPAPAGGPVATPGAFAAPQSTPIGQTPQGQPIALGLTPVTVDIRLNAENDAKLSGLVASSATPAPGEAAPQATLTLMGVRDLGAPGVTYGVYVNPPAGLGPDPRDPSFVGTISLFGLLAPTGQGMAGHGGQQSFNITRAVQAAQARGDWQGRVVVTFIPEGLVPLGGAVATPAAGASAGLTATPQVSWVTIDQITVSTIG